MTPEKNFLQLIHENLQTLRSHLRLFSMIFLGSFCIIAFFTLTTPKMYEAKTTFYFPMQSESGAGDLSKSVLGKNAEGIFASLLPSSSQQATLQNYAQGILQSRRVADQIIGRFHLMQYYHTRLPSGAEGALHRATTIKLTNEGIMEITVKADSPTLSADLANGYVDAYQDYVAGSTMTIAQKHRMDVENRLEELKKVLSQSETDMNAFQTAHKTMDSSAEAVALAGALLQLQVQRLTGEAKVKSAQTTYEYQKNLTTSQLSASAINPLLTPRLDDRVIENLRLELADIYTHYAEAKATETKLNPDLQHYQAQLRDTETILRNELRRQISTQAKGMSPELINSQLKVGSYQAEVQALDRAIAQLRERLSYYPTIALEFSRKKRNLTILNSLYTYLSMEREKAKLNEAKESPSFVVLDKAIPPDLPTGTRRLYSLLLGLLLSFVLAVVGIHLTEYFNAGPLQALLSQDGHSQHPDEFQPSSRKG